ncbi:MAG: hypothetical protein PHE43_01875 [Candidatus Nanoarchaeia archaeon]|nr:hypothetical protein [Candidatus Nanoarchaeia archaeon]
MSEEIFKILDLEKGIKKYGLFAPTSIFLILAIIDRFSFSSSMFLFISAIISVGYIVIKDRWKSKLGESKGDELSQKLKEIFINDNLIAFIFVYFTFWNLIFSIIALIDYIIKNYQSLFDVWQDYFLIVVGLLAIMEILYIILVILINYKELKQVMNSLKR